MCFDPPTTSALNQACPCPPAVNIPPTQPPGTLLPTPSLPSPIGTAQPLTELASLDPPKPVLSVPYPQPVLSSYPGAAASHRGSLRSVSPCSLTAASPSLRSGHAGHPAPPPQAKPVTHSTKGYAGYWNVLARRVLPLCDILVNPLTVQGSCWAINGGAGL